MTNVSVVTQVAITFLEVEELVQVFKKVFSPGQSSTVF